MSRGASRQSEEYELLPRARSVSLANNTNNGIGKMRINKWHLGEAEIPFALQFGQQMALAEYVTRPT